MEQTAAAALSYLSKCVGQNETIVQAGGGNTSVKLNEKEMLVKSSGFQLTDVTAEDGYSTVDYRQIAERLAEGNIPEEEEQPILSRALCSGRKPSIETFLHAVTRRFTIHTHPLGTTVYAVRQDGMAQLQAMFPDAVTVDYATPGIHLAELFYQAARSHADARRFFLKNHGLVVTADSLEEALALHWETILRIDASLGMDTGYLETGNLLFAALQKEHPGCIAYPADTAAIREAIARNGAAWDYAYTPDCVVYFGNRIAEVSAGHAADDLRRHEAQYGQCKVLLCEGRVFAVAPNVRKARDIVCMLDFAARIELAGSGTTLSQQEKDFLLHWDSEKYRVSLA